MLLYTKFRVFKISSIRNRHSWEILDEQEKFCCGKGDRRKVYRGRLWSCIFAMTGSILDYADALEIREPKGYVQRWTTLFLQWPIWMVWRNGETLVKEKRTWIYHYKVIKVKEDGIKLWQCAWRSQMSI